MATKTHESGGLYGWPGLEPSALTPLLLPFVTLSMLPPPWERNSLWPRCSDDLCQYNFEVEILHDEVWCNALGSCKIYTPMLMDK